MIVSACQRTWLSPKGKEDCNSLKNKETGWPWFLGCRCMQPLSWNAINAGFVCNNAMQWKFVQCSWHSFLFLCDFDFGLIFFFLWKTQIDYFFKDVITHAISSYFFANLVGDSLKVYVLFDLVTWQFWSDDNGAVWHLINQPKYWSWGFPLSF